MFVEFLGHLNQQRPERVKIKTVASGDCTIQHGVEPTDSVLSSQKSKPPSLGTFPKAASWSGLLVVSQRLRRPPARMNHSLARPSLDLISEFEWQTVAALNGSGSIASAQVDGARRHEWKEGRGLKRENRICSVWGFAIGAE